MLWLDTHPLFRQSIFNDSVELERAVTAWQRTTQPQAGDVEEIKDQLDLLDQLYSQKRWTAEEVKAWTDPLAFFLTDRRIDEMERRLLKTGNRELRHALSTEERATPHFLPSRVSANFPPLWAENTDLADKLRMGLRQNEIAMNLKWVTELRARLFKETSSFPYGIQVALGNTAEYDCTNHWFRIGAFYLYDLDNFGVITHEVGHVWFEQNISSPSIFYSCNRDTEDPLWQDIQILSFREHAYRLVSDSQYIDRPVHYGHPWENTTELFASAFMAYVCYPEAFLKHIADASKIQQRVGVLIWCYMRDRVFNGEVFSIHDPYRDLSIENMPVTDAERLNAIHFILSVKTDPKTNLEQYEIDMVQATAKAALGEWFPRDAVEILRKWGLW